MTGVLLLSLTACGTLSNKKPNPITIEVPTPTLPPNELLKDCKDKARVIRTNEDLAEAYNDRGTILELCNADKEALRKWRDTLKEGVNE